MAALPYRGIDWDDSLEQTDQATAISSKGLLRVERWLSVRASSTPLTLPVMESIQRIIFLGLFPDFARVLRGPAPRYIPTDVEFGNYHGTRHMQVPDACAALFKPLPGLIAQLDGLRASSTPDEFDHQVLRLAAYVHCEIIRIHPFVNGNGRSARACLNYFAWRYGMVPIAITRPKGAYLEANTTWLQYRVIEHMVDFLSSQWRRQMSLS